MKYQTLWIPLSFCQLVLEESYYSEAQQFVALKVNFGGSYKSTSGLREKVVERIGKSESTFYRNMKKLKDRNWTGYDDRSKKYFIRGFRTIYKMEGIKGITAVEFLTEWLTDFRGFIAAALFGNLVHQQKRGSGSWSDKKGQGTKLHSEQGSRLPQYGPIATNALQKMYNLSYTTAYRLKQQAHEFGGIDLKRSGRPLGLPVRTLPFLKKYNEQLGKKIFVYKGQLYKREPDFVKPELQYKSIDRYKFCI